MQLAQVKAAIRSTQLFPTLKAVQEEFSPSHRLDRRRRTAFYAQFVKPGDLVFDVGANIGNRTGPLLELGARVVAIDPQPLCISTLNRRFGRHPRCTVLPIGVGASSGSTTLHLATNHVTSSMSQDFITNMSFEGSEWTNSVEVRVASLDLLIALFGVPAFCKIDVEGYEGEVLRGLSHPLPALSLEHNPDMAEVSVHCLQVLSRLDAGYRFAYSEGETMTWSRHGWMGAPEAVELARSGELPFGDFYAKEVSELHRDQHGPVRENG